MEAPKSSVSKSMVWHIFDLVKSKRDALAIALQTLTSVTNEKNTLIDNTNLIREAIGYYFSNALAYGPTDLQNDQQSVRYQRLSPEQKNILIKRQKTAW